MDAIELTGKITGIKPDIYNNKCEITFFVNEMENIENKYDEIKNEDKLNITIKKCRKKRSLDANAYFHVLVKKLADKIRISKTMCKNIMICRYGQPFVTENGNEAVIKTNISERQMLENSMVHCMPCGQKYENGQEVIYYKIYRGSSTYDTKEMSILLDGVVTECKDHDIETITDKEIERMNKMWKA